MFRDIHLKDLKYYQFQGVSYILRFTYNLRLVTLRHLGSYLIILVLLVIWMPGTLAMAANDSQEIDSFRDEFADSDNVVTAYSEVEHYLEDSETYGQATRALRAIRRTLVRDYDSSKWSSRQQQMTERTEAWLERFYRSDMEFLRDLRVAYIEVLMYEPKRHLSINESIRMERLLADRINLMNYRFASLWLVRNSRNAEFRPKDLQGFDLVCKDDLDCWQDFLQVYQHGFGERLNAICEFLGENTGCERYQDYYKAWLQFIANLIDDDRALEALRAEVYAYLLAYQEINELPLSFIYFDHDERRLLYFKPNRLDRGFYGI